jgi:4-diphosphocytidyl-2-C-methyl-D-erythritol kinase
MARAERAPAKLNLYLHVVGRRGDGYHLLDSLVAFADIADEIIAAPAATLSLAVTGPCAAGLGDDATTNLVWRAAERLAAHLGRTPGAALMLVKNLPVASGIGGGSSDAAAALRALCDLWQARIAPEALAAIAAELGADVPVCLVPRASWLGGIGERVEPAAALPPVAAVLANPGIALATKDVFARRRGPFSDRARFAGAARDARHLAALLEERRNDLTEAATALVPEIGRVLARLAATKGVLLARLSGSGATCFALYGDAGEAAAAAAQLRAEEPGWWVAASRLR